jgi:hypothetical protein
MTEGIDLSKVMLNASHPPIILWAAGILHNALKLRREGKAPGPMGIVPGGMSGDESFTLAVAQAIFLSPVRSVRSGETEPFQVSNLVQLTNAPIIRDMMEKRILAFLRGEQPQPYPQGVQPEPFEVQLREAVISLMAEQRRRFEAAVYSAVEKVVGKGYAPLVAAQVSTALIPPAAPAVAWQATAQAVPGKC